MKKFRLGRLERKDLWAVVAPMVGGVLLLLFVAYQFIQPAPPKRLVIAVSQDEGGYSYYVRRYQSYLARHGVTLEVRESSGPAESRKLLEEEGSGIDLAFAQSGTLAPPAAPRSLAAEAEAGVRPEASPGAAKGTAEPRLERPSTTRVGGARGANRARRNVGLEEQEKEAEKSAVVSLGALYYQPLWIFYRGDELEDLRGLRGKRISVGLAGSGTHSLAMQLLSANEAASAPTQLMELGRDAAIEKLSAGELDALFIVSPTETPFLKRLIRVPGVRLLSLARAEGYTRRFPFLSKLALPRGVFDFAKDLPGHDVGVVAPTANLVARRSLHPALAYLVMRAATDIHYSSGLLDRTGEFPAPMDAGVPLSEEAKRYYKSGAPFLQRYLPFWLANLIDRLWVMIVPLIALLVPLFKAVPPLFRWRVRSRIFRMYARLKETELQLEQELDAVKLVEILGMLDEMEHQVHRLSLPLSYSEELYSFRRNVNLVRVRVRDLLARASGTSTTQHVEEKVATG